MHQKFFSSLFLLLFLNLLIKPFWIFGIDRTVQLTIGKEEYGTYFYLYGFAMLFHILLDVGINNFNNRAIAQKPSLLPTYFPTICLIKLTLGVLYLSICWFGAWYMGYDQMLLTWIALNQVFLSFILYFRSNLQGLHLFRQDSLLSILDRALMILICGALLWTNVTTQVFQIEWFIYAQTMSYVVALFVGLYFVLRQLTDWRQQQWWQPQLFLQILKQSYPFALLGILMSLYNRLDSVMLEALLPEKIGTLEVGIYAYGYRLLDAANMFALLFASLLLPIFSRLLHQKKEVYTLVDASSRLLFATSFIVATCCYFFQEPIMLLLYNSANAYEASILGYLLLSFVPMASIYIYGTLLTAHGSLWQLNLIALGGVCLNVLLNYWVIPNYLALGATVATFITQSIVALAHVGIAIKQLKLTYSAAVWKQYILFSLGALFFIGGSSLLPFHWLLNASLGGIASVGWLIVTRMVNINMFIRIVKQRINT